MHRPARPPASRRPGLPHVRVELQRTLKRLVQRDAEQEGGAQARPQGGGGEGATEGGGNAFADRQAWEGVRKGAEGAPFRAVRGVFVPREDGPTTQEVSYGHREGRRELIRTEAGPAILPDDAVVLRGQRQRAA